MDVVFVCSEGEGMESVVTLLVPEKTSNGYLPGFVQLLDGELKKLGISPHFGLVGFSGKAPVHRPGHVHTIKGRFLSEAKDFRPEVIENIEFAERSEFVLVLLFGGERASFKDKYKNIVVKTNPTIFFFIYFFFLSGEINGEWLLSLLI